MKTVARTHTGPVKKENQDRYLIQEFPQNGLLVAVADGMGGEVGGADAAQLVKDKLTELRDEIQISKSRLLDTVLQADKTLCGLADRMPELEGIGTTVCGVLIINRIAHWVHVGDSRIYLYRNQILSQITKDQNMAQFLVDEGELTPEEAQTHKSRRFLEQSVGCGHCEPETGCFPLKDGDLILLTTDGLHGTFQPGTLHALLKVPNTIDEKADRLMAEALAAGTRDNLTIVIAEV